VEKYLHSSKKQDESKKDRCPVNDNSGCDTAKTNRHGGSCLGSQTGLPGLMFDGDEGTH